MKTLFLGDALQHLTTLPTNSVDVGVTSPPYNLGGDFHSSSVNDGIRRSFGGYGGFDDNLPEPEYQAQQVAVLNELHRVIKPTGWLFYVHKNRIKNGRIISPITWLIQTNWIIYQDVVIDMAGTTNVDKRRFFPSHEFCFVLSAGDGNKLNNQACLTSIWKFPQVNRKDVNHPASFHPGLPQICIEASTTPGQTVIDPYMGSGTTGIVAGKLDLNFIGIEINRVYFENAQRAINATAQPNKQNQAELLTGGSAQVTGKQQSLFSTLPG